MGEDEKRLVIHERLLIKNRRKETYLLDFENMFVCVVAGGASFVVCVAGEAAGLGVLVEDIVFFIAPIAAEPAAEALAFTFETVALGKSFCAAGLDCGMAREEQLWSAGNRCEGQN